MEKTTPYNLYSPFKLNSQGIKNTGAALEFWSYYYTQNQKIWKAIYKLVKNEKQYIQEGKNLVPKENVRNLLPEGSTIGLFCDSTNLTSNKYNRYPILIYLFTNRKLLSQTNREDRDQISLLEKLSKKNRAKYLYYLGHVPPARNNIFTKLIRENIKSFNLSNAILYRVTNKAPYRKKENMYNGKICLPYSEKFYITEEVSQFYYKRAEEMLDIIV